MRKIFKNLISALVYLLIAVLTEAQTDPMGERLADGYHGLWIVIVTALGMMLIHLVSAVDHYLWGIDDIEWDD